MKCTITNAVLFASAGWVGAHGAMLTSTRATPMEGREATPAVVNPAIRSPLRPTLNLDGAWNFATDPKFEGEAEGWYQPAKALPLPRKIQVPGCWEAQGVGEPGLSQAGPKIVFEPVNVKMQATYTGAAWYKKEVAVPTDWAGKQVWLKIGGVNSQGWFWVNGTFLGRVWAYCGTYKYNITDLVHPGQPVTMAVLVRNDVPSRRGESNCVRTYGGLCRSVELDATPGILIENAFVEPLLDQSKARVHVTLRNTTGHAPGDGYEVEASIRPVGDQQRAGAVHHLVTVGPGATSEFAWEVNVNPCRPWSPEDPFLYRADIVLKQDGRPVDGWVERFGMKKYEVSGGDMRLNNHRFFVRGFGDDSVYPISVCSPASREQHAAHLRIAKAYGFNYVRHHTHCEIPEFYEAADEVGLMVQPELPYYGEFRGKRPYSHMSGAPLMAKDDLLEIISHYRRYTSLAIYCGGNEGHSPMPLYQELFQMAKSLDPSRPWSNLDGGKNSSRVNSDVNHDWRPSSAQVHPLLEDDVWPRVLHEYMSLGINEDPRLESKYTGAYAPNQRLQDVKTFVTRQVGLDWKWANACFDAGHRLQGIHHKIGIEAARNDPFLDGFSCWLMVDISPSSQNGVLNMFWEQKGSTPEYFRQFNAPTVILARSTGTAKPEALGRQPSSLIYSEGDVLEVDWVVSHFQPRPIAGAQLRWQLVAGRQTVAQGQLDGLAIAAGAVVVVGRSRIEMPALPKAARANLNVEIPEAGARNSWDLWVYPKFRSGATGGEGVAASSEAWSLLSKRYPAVCKLGSPAAAAAPVVVASSLADEGVLEALEQGKNVICLSLPGFDLLRPGTRLDWWSVTDQTGTAIADHAAWGDFPHASHLDQGWFRLVGHAEKLDPGHSFRTVEPLMIGIGRSTKYTFGTLGYPLGFNLYAFQANVGKGKLLATGLDLTAAHPEAVYLLDQFIRYARSERFRPKGEIDRSVLREHVKRVGAMHRK